MNYKLTALRLLLIASLVPISSSVATARGEHGEGGGGAAPQQMQRAFAPPQQSMAPQQMQRSFAPPQQRMAPQQMQRAVAPPQQRMAPQQMQRAFAPPQQRMAPQQMQRAFAPPQQRMAPQQMQRAFAPPQQRMSPQQMQRAFAPAQQRRSSPRQERMFSAASQPRIQAGASNRAFVSNTKARNSSARQMMPRTMRGATARLNSTERKNSVERLSEKNYGNVNRARQIAQRDQRTSRTSSEKNYGNVNRAKQIAQRDQRTSKTSSEKNYGNVNRARQIAQRDQRASKSRSSANLATARSLSANKGKPSANGRMLATVAGIKQTRVGVSRPSSFANPRKAFQLSAGSKPRITSARPQRLAYRSGAGNIPRAGRAGKGRAGIIDPGGFIRTAEKGTARLDRSHIQQQLAALPNYGSNFSNNNRFRISDHSRWSSHWNPGPGSAVLGYYPSYSWNGTNYPFRYYAPSGFCPTPYLFLSSCGAFWQPGVGYANSLPYGYNQPMSIAIDEVVPEYDAYGNVIGYHDETFYYNAAWDPNAQAYGYYDYRGGFHWVTFPWLNSWNAQNSLERNMEY